MDKMEGVVGVPGEKAFGSNDGHDGCADRAQSQKAAINVDSEVLLWETGCVN
jgi:hypothetical protein